MCVYIHLNRIPVEISFLRMTIFDLGCLFSRLRARHQPQWLSGRCGGNTDKIQLI